MKACSKCGTEKTLSEFYHDMKMGDRHKSQCKDCEREYLETRTKQNRERQRQWYENLREEAFNAYGHACACCGEDRSSFLTFDHVGGGGGKHRRTKGEGVSNIYRWLKNNGYPQDGTFRLLCWNCNCAEGIRGGCPHEESG